MFSSKKVEEREQEASNDVRASLCIFETPVQFPHLPRHTRDASRIRCHRQDTTVNSVRFIHYGQKSGNVEVTSLNDLRPLQGGL